jgi:hypothetical protein
MEINDNSRNFSKNANPPFSLISWLNIKPKYQNESRILVSSSLRVSGLNTLAQSKKYRLQEAILNNELKIFRPITFAVFAVTPADTIAYNMPNKERITRALSPGILQGRR